MATAKHGPSWRGQQPYPWWKRPHDDQPDGTVKLQLRHSGSQDGESQLASPQLDVDAGESSGFQFQQAVGANRLPIELRVRGITSVGSRAITAFGFKVYDYDTSILSSHSSAVASFTASGRYSGTVSELDGTYNSVVGGLAKVVGADVTATANGGHAGLNVGTLTLGIVGSDVTLIDFEIENLEIYNTPSATKLTELQYVDAFTDVGYASVTSSRRERRLEAMDWQRTSAGVMSPTVATPATHLAAFVRPRPPRPRAADRVRRVCLHGVERLQRCLQFLAERYIYIASLLARLAHASCVQSSVAGSTIDVLRIIAQVVGSNGQNVGMVGADPSRTDGVRRAAREPCCDHVRRGRWLRRDGPLSIHPADGPQRAPSLGWEPTRPGCSCSSATSAEATTSCGCQPRDSTNSVDFSYEFALLVETWSAAGAQEAPNNFKPWLGSSIAPYTDSGFAFKPIWGVVVARRW